MINSIIAFSIKNKLIIGLMIVAWIGAGVWAMSTVNLGSVPDITNNQVQVITVSENLSTEDIEQFVTYPVELAMANLPGVEEIRSVSRFGLSVVTIVFEEDMGTYLPRQLVQEKLSEVSEEIPEQFGTPSMGPISTGLGEIYQYTLKPQPGYDTVYTPSELRTIQDWIVARQMALVPGVVEVNAFGGNIKQYEVALDPGRLNSMNVSISEVFEALEKNNVNTGGAYIERNSMANFIRGEGLVRSLDDIRNIVIRNDNGTPILIRDVADAVQFGSQVRYGAFTQDGQEAVGGMVLMLRGESPDKVINAVKERMAEVQKSLPEGLVIEPFIDQSNLIARTTSTVTTNLTEGALIVVFVLVLLLGSLRGGLITASVIPLALLFAFILMRVFNVSANLMSLGAIDFGIIVDGAVIIVEGTVHMIEKKIRQGNAPLGQEQMDEIAYESGSNMMNSAFFGQIIILIVFAPILFLTGVEGKMFQPMAFTFGFAVLGAIILCLTYVPMVAALFLKPTRNKKSLLSRFERGVEHISNRLMGGINSGYLPLLRKSLNHKPMVVITALLLLAGAGYTFSRMGGEFIPSLDEGDIAMQALLRPGSSLSESIEQSKKMEKIVLENFPEVKTMVARIGVSAIPTDPMPMDIADTYIILEKDMGKWESADSKEELIEKIKEKLSVLPGINYVFSQPVELRFNELISGVREDVAVKLYGEDLNILAAKAQQMAQIIQSVPGAGDVNLEAVTGLPQMTVRFDRGKIAQYGLDIEKLNNYISSAFAGGEAGVVFEGEKRFDIVVRLSEKNRRSIEDLRNLYIDLPNGEQVPLQQVADISYQPGPMQISRDNTFRRVNVGVNVRGRDVESMVNDIQERLDAQLDLPPGYYVTYGGSFENLQRAKARLQVVVPIALALIFVLLYFALKSLSQAFMIYMAVPLAAIGGVFALALRGMPFSISAGVGFIVLFGVAVLNGLVLVSRFNSLKEEGVTDLRQRIFIGTEERLRPILLTATAAIMGFIPMALSASAGAEVQRPLATVVIGGLITATFLTLVVMPILYYFVEARSGKSGGKAATAVAPSFLLPFLLGAGLLFSPGAARAQEVTALPANLPALSVEEAVQRAVTNYPSITAAQLDIESQQALKKTAWNLGSTQVFTGKEEYGQGNEDAVDNRIGIQQQNIEVFGVAPKLRLQQEQVGLAQSVLKLTALEVAREVRIDWSDAYAARRRYVLYEQLDSVLAEFTRAAEVRYETEAISYLEYLAATNQSRKVAVEKEQAFRDYRVALRQLNQWLGSDTFYTVATPEPEQLTAALPALTDSLTQHPLLEYSRQQVEVAQARERVAKAAYLPSLSGQYASQEIGGQPGFYSYQVGVNFPLLPFQERGRAQSARIEREIAGQNLRRAQLELQAEYGALVETYHKWLNSWQYYQQEALPLAVQQRNGAIIAYREGAVDYIGFLQIIRDAIQVELDAQEALDNYLDTKARLIYFLQKTNQ
ncbi:cobalt-zinc-cadmium resistance protein CzcA [Pontibacter ummariensis]|uniref:Cobalt-zinc-cadmium resistance protein CzcA n=1 Tax=Pontibacter ummariensis TaxID=1610492 RepID=A0A239DN33_9BACT|nr:CusA/CzcA family heavy metal efflux RND transporter [Pontibacter ummariensis]PRY13838.1 cobalt-zinc-cadmium resistance protein CzcA [Pontibacter ummariensis]SNS33896.1 cobalt-zinc-cadmium resistance protein CzcA [Pontibacter ummariensis]